MARRGERPAVAARVPVSVTDPGRPVRQPLPAPPPPSRRPAFVLLVLPVVLLAVLAVRDHRRQVQHSERRVAARVRIQVLGATADPLGSGVPGAPLQTGVAVLELRNPGRTAVRVLDARLDAGGPVSPGNDRQLLPGHTLQLPVAWEVRCAEIGSLPGPRLLELRIRLASASSYAVTVPLPAAVTDRPFHRAASTACDVLVAR